MRRFLLITPLVLLAVLAVAVALVFYLANNEDFLKGQAGKFVFEATGRQLTFEGPLELSLGRETTLEASTGLCSGLSRLMGICLQCLSGFPSFGVLLSLLLSGRFSSRLGRSLHHHVLSA